MWFAGILALPVAAWARWGLTASALSVAVLSVAMVVVAKTDLDRGTVPDLITLPGVAAGVAFSWFDSRVTPWESMAGAVLGAVGLLAVARLYRMLHPRHEHGLGLGNVKLLAMVGAFLGWQGMLMTLFLGSLLGTVGALLRGPLGGRPLAHHIPFATFLAVAAIATAWFGGWALDWYLGLLQ
jgi:leader peptidase (prepilin peptidase)/N-methyltransferase